jgi:hypothetical protein
MHALRDSFYIGGTLSAVAAILSVLRGKKYAHPGNTAIQDDNGGHESKSSVNEKTTVDSSKAGVAGLRVK